MIGRGERDWGKEGHCMYILAYEKREGERERERERER